MIRWKLFMAVLLTAGIGVAAGWAINNKIPDLNLERNHIINKITGVHRPMIYGFLPYWLVEKASNNYTENLTDIGYFAVIVDSDGSLVKINDKKEGEPGWNKLKSDSLANFRKTNKNVKYSLVVQSGVDESITKLIADPENHAKKMMEEIEPIMKQYGYNDLNLDIESLRTGNDTERNNFNKFVKTVREHMKEKELGTLGLELPVAAFTKKTIIDPARVQPLIDYAVLMAYDYHYRGSLTTGPVAPVGGAGAEREIDMKIIVSEALKSFKPEQLVLGNPWYGYAWETINENKEAPVIPGSGLTASGRRVEELLRDCQNCKVTRDEISGEKIISYKDPKYGSIHQIYIGDEKTLEKKIEIAKNLRLGGVAFWAMGYETSGDLSPLKTYKEFFWRE